MSESVMMTLISNDGEEFKVPVNVARMSGLLNGVIEEQEEEDIGKQDTKLQNVSGVVLKRVVEFCTHYQQEAMNEVVAKGKEKLEEIVTHKWYLNFIKSVDGDGLFLLIQATNYLDIQSLLSLSVLALCDFINNKSEDMIRETFNITKPETSRNAEWKEDEKVAN